MNVGPALFETQIRNQIFGFLPLDSIKTCRLVCHEWNATAEELLMKRSRIRFYNNRDDPDEARLPDRFIDEFKAGALLKKCNKFCFNSPVSSIEYEDMSSFIEEYGDGMNELTIFRTNIRNVLYELSSKDLINLIPSNLTKLEVVTENVKSQLIIPMKRLTNIKTLRLGGCILKIHDATVCAPVELRLKNVFFLRNQMNYQVSVTLNKLFDLRNLKALHLHCSDTGNIILDVSDGALNLKELSLKRVELMNWESSTWNVDKLTLSTKMKIDAAVGLKFKELTFSGPTLDMALLPTTLERLAIERFKTKLLHIEIAKNLVQLKYLALHRKEFSLLTNFHACANLTHLHLIPRQGEDDELATVNVNLIPKTLKVFRLSYKCELIGKMDFAIDTLIIENIPFGDAYDYITENLTIKNGFLYCSDFDFDTDDGAEIEEVVQGLSLQSFIVGPLFRSESDRFSFLSVDRTAEYLMKTCKDGDTIKKEVDKQTIDRLKNSWWTNEEVSF